MNNSIYIGLISAGIGLLALTIHAFISDKRLNKLENKRKCECPYLTPRLADGYKPYLKECPLYQGNCFRWDICYRARME